jgi:GNAT superfamily N-acetyltransferase
MRVATSYGTFSLSTLPGCAQVCVSHAAFVLPEHRGKGIGQQDHQERLNLVKDLKYDLVLCTVHSANLTQKHILGKNGWTKLTEFKNSNNGHLVELWCRHMKE